MSVCGNHKSHCDEYKIWLMMNLNISLLKIKKRKLRSEGDKVQVSMITVSEHTDVKLLSSLVCFLQEYL